MAWTDKQLAFMDWLNADPEDREFATEKEVAEQLDVAPITLWSWKKIHGFDEARIKRANLVFHMKSPQILNAMLRSLSNPENVKEMVQWFRYANLFNLRAMEAGTFDDVRDDAPHNRKELSPEKVQERLAGMDEATRQQFLGLIYDMNLLPQPTEIPLAQPTYNLVKEIRTKVEPLPDGRSRSGRRKGSVRRYQPEPENQETED